MNDCRGWTTDRDGNRSLMSLLTQVIVNALTYLLLSPSLAKSHIRQLLTQIIKVELSRYSHIRILNFRFMNKSANNAHFTSIRHLSHRHTQAQHTASELISPKVIAVLLTLNRSSLNQSKLVRDMLLPYHS